MLFIYSVFIIILQCHLNCGRTIVESILRLSPLDPMYTEGEQISLQCRTTSTNIPISEVYLRIQVTDNARQFILSEEIFNNTRIINSSAILMETTATIEWDQAVVNCCYMDKCEDQLKIIVCYEPPRPSLVEYKILDWKDLIIRWNSPSLRPGITVISSYRVNFYDDSSVSFTDCIGVTDDGYGCTVGGFFQGLERTDVAMEIQVYSKNKCNKKSEVVRVGPSPLEEIVQMKPIENMTYITTHNDGSSPNKGHVTLTFSISTNQKPLGRLVLVNIRCSCPEVNYTMDTNITTTNNSIITYQLTQLPIYKECKCWVKVRSLGWWSDDVTVDFMSPQNVPQRNPSLFAFSMKHCQTNQITIFFESLSTETTQGPLKFLQLSSQPIDRCSILASQESFNKCQPDVQIPQVKGCNGSLNFEPYVTLSTTSPTVNVTFRVENDAGPCPVWNSYTINTESRNVVTNFSIAKLKNETIFLSWDFPANPHVVTSLVVMWSQCTTNKNCMDLQWKDIPATSTNYSIDSSSIEGRSVVFGVGGRLLNDAVALIQLRSDICLNSALPLAPSIVLKDVNASTATINFNQPNCNNTGFPYNKIVRFFKLDDNNETDIIEERQVDSSESLEIYFEIPEDTRYRYEIIAFSQSLGGLSHSNKIDIKPQANNNNINNNNNNNNDKYYLFFLVFIILAVFPVIWVYRKCKKQNKLKIHVPEQPTYFYSQNTNAECKLRQYEIDRMLENCSNSSDNCSEADSRSNDVTQPDDIPQTSSSSCNDYHFIRTQLKLVPSQHPIISDHKCLDSDKKNGVIKIPIEATSKCLEDIQDKTSDNLQDKTSDNLQDISTQDDDCYKVGKLNQIQAFKTPPHHVNSIDRTELPEYSTVISGIV